jgi:hypothetical protein
LSKISPFFSMDEGGQGARTSAGGRDPGEGVRAGIDRSKSIEPSAVFDRSIP